MRRVAIPLSLALGLVAANAAETEDRPLRAAYCIGVIDQRLAADQGAAAEVRGL